MMQRIGQKAASHKKAQKAQKKNLFDERILTSIRNHPLIIFEPFVPFCG
jgi:hypothetical protein